MKKSNKKGFTLVELVVVIAIIGVLAAILVPSMMGYVKKSRLKTANANAKTAYNAVATYVADMETAGTPVISNGTFSGGGAYTATSATGGTDTDLAKVIYEALGDNGNEAGIVYVNCATINSNADAFFCHWRKTSSDNIVGQYPEATADVDSCPAWDTWTAQ